MPDSDVPRTRGACPVVRPCPHVHCRYHLFREDGNDRPGRPGLASVPRDASGKTLPIVGDAGQQRAPTTLRPVWLLSDEDRLAGVEPPHNAPSCALDGREKPQENAEVGEQYGKHRTKVGRDVRKALEHAKRVAAELGISEGDLLLGLKELGDMTK